MNDVLIKIKRNFKKNINLIVDLKEINIKKLFVLDTLPIFS